MSSGTRTRRANDVFANYVMVLLGFVALAVFVVLVVSWRQEERLPEVDYSTDADTFAEVAPFTAYVPEDLPDSWVPTSSRLDTGGAAAGEEPTDPVMWDVGFVTGSEEYASLRVSDAELGEFIAEMTENGAPDGTEAVGGERWERYYSEERGRRSLVLPVDGATLIVTGTANYEELAVLAASLEPATS